MTRPSSFTAMLAFGLGATALGPCGARAAEGALTGAWCSDEGVMWIREDGIGFNAHTLCAVGLPVALGPSGAYDTALACENVYVTGENADGTLIAEHLPMPELTRLRLTGLAGGLMADFGTEGQVAYTRCAWDAEGATQ